jgi:hypothetical protein
MAYGYEEMDKLQAYPRCANEVYGNDRALRPARPVRI